VGLRPRMRGRIGGGLGASRGTIDRVELSALKQAVAGEAAGEGAVAGEAAMPQAARSAVTPRGEEAPHAIPGGKARDEQRGQNPNGKIGIVIPPQSRKLAFVNSVTSFSISRCWTCDRWTSSYCVSRTCDR
jgi:hypothetical protein